MNNFIDMQKTINSPIGKLIISNMASSVCWLYDHMVNEIKSNSELFKGFSLYVNKYKYQR